MVWGFDFLYLIHILFKERLSRSPWLKQGRDKRLSYFLETIRVGVVVFSKIRVYSLLSFKFVMAFLSLEH